MPKVLSNEGVLYPIMFAASICPTIRIDCDNKKGAILKIDIGTVHEREVKTEEREPSHRDVEF